MSAAIPGTSSSATDSFRLGPLSFEQSDSLVQSIDLFFLAQKPFESSVEPSNTDQLDISTMSPPSSSPNVQNKPCDNLCKAQPLACDNSHKEDDDDDIPLHLLLPNINNSPQPRTSTSKRQSANKWSFSRRLRRVLSIKGNDNSISKNSKSGKENESRRDKSKEDEEDEWEYIPRPLNGRAKSPSRVTEDANRYIPGQERESIGGAIVDTHARSPQSLLQPAQLPKRIAQFIDFELDELEELHSFLNNSTNSQIYTPPASPSLSSSFNSSTFSTSLRRHLQFSDKVSVYETYPPSLYDRHSDNTATFAKLNASLIMQIKRELNEYKASEMAVHEESRMFTHFFT
ncbi:uncharacterized protein VTP21DRAFT_7388 [Calcarisporiella thermophila]|uniref:uncharacterized protein n=1 Tax=Calcarisporiella thermophila TaxID=911321 RepID=UPI0037435259